MARRVLEEVKMGRTYTSYMSSVDGVLRGAGLWKDDIYRLMGMTGMAFHFIVHQKTCPSSVTVYDWMNEHLVMMDRIGVHSEVFQAFNDGTLNTFPQMQKKAVERIKDSIDRGMAVVAWAPTPILEFGIIKGYDDEDKVFIVDPMIPGSTPDPLLYSNLGKSEVPFLFYQVFYGKVDIDLELTYRGSLEFGLSEWNKEFHINPYYASGRKGYANLLKALKSGKFDEFGLAYILTVYADAKKCIEKYLNFLAVESTKLHGLEKPANLYQQIAGRFEEMTKLAPFKGPRNTRVDRENLPKLAELVADVAQLEDEAMNMIAEVLET